LEKILIKLNDIYNDSFSIIGIYQLVWIVEKAHAIIDDDKFNTYIEKISEVLKEENVDELLLSFYLAKLFMESIRYKSKRVGILEEPKLPFRIKIQCSVD
jgi:hypothetical protein